MSEVEGTLVPLFPCSLPPKQTLALPRHLRYTCILPRGHFPNQDSHGSVTTLLTRTQARLFKRLGLHGLRSPFCGSDPLRFAPGQNPNREQARSTISPAGRISPLRIQLYGRLHRLQTQVGDFQPIEGRCERDKKPDAAGSGVSHAFPIARTVRPLRRERKEKLP